MVRSYTSKSKSELAGGEGSNTAGAQTPPRLVEEAMSEGENPRSVARKICGAMGLESETESCDSFDTSPKDEVSKDTVAGEVKEEEEANEEGHSLGDGGGEIQEETSRALVVLATSAADRGSVNDNLEETSRALVVFATSPAVPIPETTDVDNGNDVIDVPSESEESPAVQPLKRKNPPPVSGRTRASRRVAPAPRKKKAKLVEKAVPPESDSSDSDQPTGFKSKKFSSTMAKERYDWFLGRKFIDERVLDIAEEDEWGYTAVVKTGKMTPTVTNLSSYVEQTIAEFYANLSTCKEDAANYGVKVFVRGREYKFSPKVINKYLGLKQLSAAEVEAEKQADLVSVEELASLLTEGHVVSWKSVTARSLSPRFAVLMLLAACNWIPSSHRSHLSVDRARLIYKMAHGIRFDFGLMVYKQVRKIAVMNKRDPRSLIFPSIIYGMLEMQHEPRVGKKEKKKSPALYKKDPRMGDTFVKQEAEKGGTSKEGGRSKRKNKAESGQSRVGFADVQLGTVRVPLGRPTRSTLKTALVDVQLALHTLSTICLELSQAFDGGESGISESDSDGSSSLLKK